MRFAAGTPLMEAVPSALTPEFTSNIPTLFSLMVIKPPPSIVVSAAIVLVPAPVLMAIVAGPQ